MLEVIYGPMFSGKTEELIRRLRRAQIGGKEVVVYKPAIDDRHGVDTITSHSGLTFNCVPILDPLMDANLDYDIIGFDEAQFFHLHNFWEYIKENRARKHFIVAGLNLDFRLEYFGAMQRIIVSADILTRLNAVCHRCKSEYGTFTQRLIDGEPAPLDGPVIQVGGLDSYEARCYNCYGVK